MGREGNLRKLTANLLSMRGDKTKNITQPFGGSVKFYCNITKILPPVPYSILSK